MAEYLQAETEAGFGEVVRKIIGSYRQSGILLYVIEAIMENTESCPI